MVNMTVTQVFVISMAVSAALLSGSGFNDAMGVGTDIGLSNAADDLRQSAQRDEFSGSVISGAINLLGLAIAGIQILVDMFIWVYLFPGALMAIGFPPWFAVPIGLPVLYANLVGTAELFRGMNIR